MKKHLYILTGASRGMGLAMAQQLLHPQHHLICISRHGAESLTQRAGELDAELEQWPLDLSDATEAATRLGQWLARQPQGRWSGATLINNAGVVAQALPLSALDAGSISQALRVGLEAPLLLTATFLQHTLAWDVPRRVLNISSGLGRKAMASQSVYCTAKAGMDQFTRCLALEEAMHPRGAKVCSLAPGVIDTDMQVQLRSGDDAQFPDRQGFVALKENGMLTSPADAAARVLAYLARPDFGSQAIADVREV